MKFRNFLLKENHIPIITCIETPHKTLKKLN